jgi:hypothetical protein
MPINILSMDVFQNSMQNFRTTGEGLLLLLPIWYVLGSDISLKIISFTKVSSDPRDK